MLELSHVKMRYPASKTYALNDVSLKIEKGEFVFIVGSSGSGKTTLIKLLLKELDPTSGKIKVADTDYSKLKRKNIPKIRRKIGVVFQNFRLLKDRTVYENVAFAQRVIETPSRYIRRQVPAMLTLVGLADKYKSFPKQLSGGEQQRVALARALVNKPEILLADEPTGNLDPKNSWEIMRLLEDVNKKGTTVVVVTHNKEIVNMMKKRVITLKHGEIISDEQKVGISMRISSFMYSIRQGIKNIKRNLLFSLASIGTIVSCLFLFGLFYCVIVNFRTAMTDLENTVTLSVFFDEGVTDENITMIGQQIRLRDEVNTLDFISADEAWKQYAEEKFDDPQAAIDAFQGDNPLKNSASYKITLKDLSNQAEFVQYLKGLTGVRKVLSSEVTADGVAALNSVVSYASIGIIVILLLVSIFLISNTITIGITVRKEEIGIMKLIGATNFFVRAPFIVEGVVIGLVGSLIPLILIYYMYDTVVQYIIGRFSVVQSLFAFVPAKEIFAVLIPLSAGIGIGLGLIGSLLTTRKHLKV